jgi:hypothetical protein
MGLIQWWKVSRRWRQDNTESWAGMDVPGEDGLTRFQKICLEALSSVTDTSGRSIEGGETEKYISGSFRASRLRWYIYEDGAEISNGNTDMRFERWDFRTLDKLLGKFVQDARKIEI